MKYHSGSRLDGVLYFHYISGLGSTYYLLLTTNNGPKERQRTAYVLYLISTVNSIFYISQSLARALLLCKL
jgi:hypothetical protein